MKIKTALALGLNQFLMFSCMALLFWAGAEIIIFYDGKIRAVDVFKSLFVLMFASFNAGSAAATGPDMGRA